MMQEQIRDDHVKERSRLRQPLEDIRRHGFRIPSQRQQLSAGFATDYILTIEQHELNIAPARFFRYLQHESPVPSPDVGNSARLTAAKSVPQFPRDDGGGGHQGIDTAQIVSRAYGTAIAS